MSKDSLARKDSLSSVKRFLFENKVILMFIVLCVGCMMIAEANVAYIASEVFNRFSRNTCLVLALVIPCLAGLGMNFGIVVGAIAAQITIIFVVHWGYTGIGSFLLCAVLSTPLAILFGWLVGALYNKTKGSEMITGLVLGFFADGLYRLFTLYIIGGVIPFDDPNLLPRGFGLRNAFDLTGSMKYTLDDISFLSVLGLISILSIVSAVLFYFHDMKIGKETGNKNLVIKLAAASAVLLFSIVAKFVPFLNEILGGKRLLLSNAVYLLAAGSVAYGLILYLRKRPQKGDPLFKKILGIPAACILAMVLGFLPGINQIYRAIRLPACTYAVICFFCFFNNWILNTHLGQNMRTVGQRRDVATSAGINVDKTRIIATCISTVLAAWGQLIFLQNLGTFNTIQQQTNVGLYSVAAILVGGANVRKAGNRHAIIGVFLFHTLFVVVPLAATKLVGDSAISEYIRMFISYGVIAVSLAMHAWQTKKPKNT